MKKISFSLFVCLLQTLFAGFPSGVLVKQDINTYVDIADCSSGNVIMTRTDKHEIMFSCIKQDQQVVSVYTSVGILYCSVDQYFFIENRQNPVASVDLKCGDKLCSKESEIIYVEKVEVLDAYADMYDLTIAQDHTFYVTEYNILVHNFALGLVPYVIYIAGTLQTVGFISQELLVAGAALTVLLNISGPYKGEYESKLVSATYDNCDCILFELGGDDTLYAHAMQWSDFVYYKRESIAHLIEDMQPGDKGVVKFLLSKKEKKRLAKEAKNNKGGGSGDKKPDDEEEKDLFKEWRGMSPKEITNAMAKKIARLLGFVETKDYNLSHGQKVFQKGNELISLDKTSHKGGFWKKYNCRLKRLGTYTIDLLHKIAD